MLSSVQTDLILFGLRSGSLDVLPSTAKKAILSLDYDWREQKVFWASLDSESIRWSSLDQKTKGTLIKGHTHTTQLEGFEQETPWIRGRTHLNCGHNMCQRHNA
jgi:hypothetical protein